MKLKIAAVAFALLATLAASAADKSKSAEKSTPGVKDTPAAEGETKKKSIQKNMTGEEITQFLGKPAEIKSMEAPEPGTKFEQWIYRRKLRESTVQVAASQTMVPTFSGFGGSSSMTQTPVIEYRNKRIVVYQVTALLMVNDRLEIAKQWNEEEEKLD